MTQVGTSGHGDEGNTKLRRRSRKYCFTLNNYTEKEYDTIVTHIEKLVPRYYIIGKEIGELGTPHIQGYIEYKNPIDFSTLKKVIPRAHIEVTRGTMKDNFKYCSKENNFITNIEVKLTVPMCPKKEIILRDWQIKAIDILNKPDERTIHWYYDTVGNTGKTTFAKYILTKYEDAVYFTGGKSTDIASQLLLMEEDPKICIFDFARSKDGYISYEALESVKNGMVNSPKYKGGWKIFPNPHVIVLANFAPDKKKLSEDRWCITELENPEVL